MAIGTVEKLYFSRDTKMYVKLATFFWEIPVLDGFSFSQASNSTEITINEAENSAGESKRARQLFNDSLAPAEFSFSTYMRPFLSQGSSFHSGVTGSDDQANHHAVEEVLWALMATKTHGYTRGTNDFSFDSFTNNTTSLAIDFSDSNSATLQEAEFYFVLGGTPNGASNATITYQLKKAVLNEASIDFDIDGLATINWSGFASEIVEFDSHSADINAALLSSGTAVVTNEGVNATNNFIRNRASTIALQSAAGTATRTAFAGGSSADAGKYGLTLTGGNITISNNITFLTPETIGAVNVPFAHVTGARSVSGSLQCYLGVDQTASEDIGTSADFFRDAATSAARNIVTNQFTLDIDIGGGTAPNVLFDMNQVHLEIPVHNVEDTIVVETAFHALPSAINTTDEISTITYKGVTPDA